MANFRAFLAIDLPETLKKKLGQLIASLSKDFTIPKIKWVNPRNLHLTLKFLGDINEKQKQFIGEKAPHLLQNFPSFQLSFSNLKLFPFLGHPRLIALFPSAIEKLLPIALSLEELAFQAGIAKEERAFLPHLTLARISNGNFLSLPKVSLNGFSFSVNQVKLFKSELQPENSIYTELFNFKLGGVKSNE